jgi:hypothetical protein
MEQIMMTKLKLLICLVALLVFTGPLYAQQREVLYPKSPPAEMQELVNSLLDPHRAQVPLNQLRVPDGYFVRITERSFVLDADKALLPKAALGDPRRPFVFLTTPDGFYGKSLVEIYGDIGYEAEQVIASQRNKEIVVLLFRYKDDVRLATAMDGRFTSDWRSQIFRTTWKNMFSLFTRLVKDKSSPACTNAPQSAQDICLSPTDRAFVMGFPANAKRQIETHDYQWLKAMGGRLWRYRKLLEDNLSMFEHFLGDGYTDNEIEDYRTGKRAPRLYEVVGPNKKLSELQDVVIIKLGTMIIEDR